MEGQVLIIAAAVLALAAGFFMGWVIGRWTKPTTLSESAAREVGLRELAQFEFEFVRTKAHEIVRLANEIATRATTAHDSVLDTHADVEQRPGLPSPLRAGVGDTPVPARTK